MKNIFRGLILGFIIGCIITSIVIFCIDLKPYVDYQVKYSLLEFFYYIFSIVGVFITALAVIVALFGNEIKNHILVGKCEVSIEPETFTENLGHTANEACPASQVYEATVKLSNSGSKWLSNCELRLMSVEYKSDDSQRKFTRINIRNFRTIFWSQPEDTKFSLREGESLSKILARIYPDNDNSTPDSSVASSKRLSLTGLSDIKKSNNNKGIWKIEYAVLNPERIVTRFQVIYKWNGEWFARASEMNDACSVELLKK